MKQLNPKTDPQKPADVAVFANRAAQAVSTALTDPVVTGAVVVHGVLKPMSPDERQQIIAMATRNLPVAGEPA